MSIMIDLPPAMAQEAQGLKSELARKAEVDKALAKLDGLVRQSHGRLSKPYKFNRADAYEPEVPCA